MKYLITGVAGFIGSHLAKTLLSSGANVVGVDNLNTYYDIALRKYRLDECMKFPNFTFERLNIAQHEEVNQLFVKEKFDAVIHLAAQVGVRHSLVAPFDYVESNLKGMVSILEACRHNEIPKLLYASSSSVYGKNAKVPFHEDDPVNNPASLYAATKRSNELMAYSYGDLYGLKSIGLRFFTVYGPAGRPDMAPWLFTEAILKGEPIKLFNRGNMLRDFTYIDDVISGIIKLIQKSDKIVEAHRVYNIGNCKPERLERFIDVLELACGVPAIREYAEMQAGDVPVTYADKSAIETLTGFNSTTSIEFGLPAFVDWYRDFKFSR